MKKPVKIIFIVALIAIGIYAIRIAYGFLILYSVSSEDRLKIAEAMYEKCKEENKGDCEYYLAKDLLDVFSKQKKEAMQTVLDNTKTEAERTEALKTFYELSRQGENKPIDRDEALLYYAVAYINEDPVPVDLSYTAFKYLLQAPVNDPRVVQVLMMIAGDPEKSPEWRAQAIKSLGEAGVKQAADIFIQALEDESWEVRSNAGDALAKIGGEEQISALLQIANDKTKKVTTREASLKILENLSRSHKIKDSSQIIGILEPLLEDTNYIVRSSSADILKILTGNDYEIDKEGSEEDIKMFIEEEYGLIRD